MRLTPKVAARERIVGSRPPGATWPSRIAVSTLRPISRAVWPEIAIAEGSLMAYYVSTFSRTY